MEYCDANARKRYVVMPKVDNQHRLQIPGCDHLRRSAGARTLDQNGFLVEIMPHSGNYQPGY